MSRVAAPATGSIGIGTRTPPAASSAPRLTGISTAASRSARRSARRCHAPPGPGRFIAAVASNRIAYGTRGRASSAVVVAENTTARASTPRSARRAASASTKSTAAAPRRSFPDEPILTGTTSMLTPAARASSANASSERTSPGVVPREINAKSATGANSNLAPVPKPAATVVVPTSNRAEYLEVTLRSLAEQDFDRPYEVVAVDDGSRDRTPEVIAAAGVRSIRHETPMGPNTGRNEGVAAADSDL